MVNDRFGPGWVGEEGFVGGAESCFGDVGEVGEEVGVADSAVDGGGRGRKGKAVAESGLFRCGCGRGGGCGG